MSLPEKPITRNETFFSAMAGEATSLPPDSENDTREQQYWRYIAEHGGGGGGDVTGVKGDNENDYRTGNVNLTAANVGAYTAEQVNTLLDDYVEKSETTGLLKNDGTVDTTSYISDISGKTDKVTTATENNLAAFDDSGNLKDSGKSSNDFAPVNIVPSNASTDNKLATAADTAGEEIASTATNTSILLTDSADGLVQGVTVKGKSRKSKNLFSGLRVGVSINANDGSFGIWNVAASSDYIPIKSGYYTVSGLIPDLMTLICFYDTNKQKTNLTTTVDKTKTLYNDGSYAYIAISQYQSENIANLVASAKIQLEEGSTATPYEPYFSGIKSVGDNGFTITTTDSTETLTSTATITTGLPLHSTSDGIYDTLDNEKVVKKCAEVDLGDLTWGYASESQGFFAALSGVGDRTAGICSDYELTTATTISNMPDKTFMFRTDQGYLYVRDLSYSDAVAFTTAVTGVKLVYPLATPTETPLTSAEKSALASLRTYDHTTYIDATDAPTMTVDYLLNTNNGKAVAGIDNKIVAIKSVSWTGTGTTTNSITFPEKPFMIIGFTQNPIEDRYTRGLIPFIFERSNSHLCLCWSDTQSTMSQENTYQFYSNMRVTISGNTMSWTGSDASQALNQSGTEYTIYYI